MPAMQALLSIDEIVGRLPEIVEDVTGIARETIRPSSRVIQDLQCDSLAFLDLIMRIEASFDVTLPHKMSEPVYKSVFTRDPFRLRDLAECVYLRQGAGRVPCTIRLRKPAPAAHACSFTQLGGRDDRGYSVGALFEPIGPNERGCPTYRRRTDGMVCVTVPTAEVTLGAHNADVDGSLDERPAHRARLDSFLIDREPVSTTAYCRFLNSIDAADARLLETWFALPPDDHRRQHELLRRYGDGGWSPLPGTERMPMMLVSWYGANAYALWANGRDWRALHGGDEDPDRDAGCFLPSEAQWEYAARGREPRQFPWGDDEPTPRLMRYAQHAPGLRHAADALPMADVNEPLGLSPFGLHHMAGNVWQWCRDWYDENFYATPDAVAANPVNRTPTRVRSERGGSWVGPSLLCRSSYRRGRAPTAKGRCLGFRCVSDVADLRGP